ncbi:MAG: hypothetical protein M3Y72_03960 [Acidobacteriota bacterium]|nr:hypothetical protein [Acidobacteriota bacterium]
MLSVFSDSTPGPSPRWLGWRVLSLFKKHQRVAAGLVALILLASGLDIAVPFLTKGLIDKIITSLGHRGSASLQTLLSAGIAIFLATAATRLLRSFSMLKFLVSDCDPI